VPVIKPSPGVLNRLRSVFRMREAPTGNSLVVPERQGVVSPEQLTGDDEQLFRALTESGYSLADALEAIRKEGLQAEMSRRDLFRLGRDTAKAGSTLSNLGALRHFVPDLTTSLYPEVSRERIMRTVKPLLERASPQQGWVSSDFPGQTWETDFNIWASGGPWDGDVRYIDPRFDDKMTAYLSKRLKSPAEHEEAGYLLQDIPSSTDLGTYFIEDGRPKEIWRSLLDEREVMPDWKSPGDLGKLPPEGAVTDANDYAELINTYDPYFEKYTVPQLEELGIETAEQYILDPIDHLKFIGAKQDDPDSPYYDLLMEELGLPQQPGTKHEEIEKSIQSKDFKTLWNESLNHGWLDLELVAYSDINPTDIRNYNIDTKSRPFQKNLKYHNDRSVRQAYEDYLKISEAADKAGALNMRDRAYENKLAKLSRLKLKEIDSALKGNHTPISFESRHRDPDIGSMKAEELKYTYENVVGPITSRVNEADEVLKQSVAEIEGEVGKASTMLNKTKREIEDEINESKTLLNQTAAEIKRMLGGK